MTNNDYDVSNSVPVSFSGSLCIFGRDLLKMNNRKWKVHLNESQNG
jgi:hypothetical protein